MKKTRNIVIGALLVSVVSMAIGYAALAQQLTINGTANISADWDIEFTNIEMKNAKGAKLHNDAAPTASGTSATFNVDLEYPGASADFAITVENLGTIDAILQSIDGVDAANSADPVQIKYTVTGVAANDALDAKASKVVNVNVKWVASDVDNDEIPTVTSKTATIYLNYKQKTA